MMQPADIPCALLNRSLTLYATSEQVAIARERLPEGRVLLEPK